MPNKDKVPFGFKNIFSQDKAEKVKKIFDSVSNKYDIMNDLMSLGVHRLWKHKLVNMLTDTNTPVLLDVGSGTGDIALSFLNKGNRVVHLVDINQQMLNIAQEKILNNGYYKSAFYTCADAQNLPFADQSFNLYSIAFCIRNTTHIEQVLSEAIRVLKPNGKFFCLEFSNVNHDLLRAFYHYWSFAIIPKIGQIATQNTEAYQYLVESIERFPNQQNFLTMLKDAGFSNCKYHNLNNGIACIHTGEI